MLMNGFIWKNSQWFQQRIFQVRLKGKKKKKNWSRKRVQFLRFRFIFHLAEEWEEDTGIKPVSYCKNVE